MGKVRVLLSIAVRKVQVRNLEGKRGRLAFVGGRRALGASGITSHNHMQGTKSEIPFSVCSTHVVRDMVSIMTRDMSLAYQPSHTVRVLNSASLPLMCLERRPSIQNSDMSLVIG